jgi:galactokinase
VEIEDATGLYWVDRQKGSAYLQNQSPLRVKRPSAQWSSPSNIGQMAGRGINAALEILSWLATTL